MPTVFPLTTSPSNLSAALGPGTYRAQAQTGVAMYYGSFPSDEPDPADTSAMFVVSPREYFVVRVGSTAHPVWVAGQDVGAGAGELILTEARNG